MKKQISLWFGGIFFVAILLLTSSCNNEDALLSKEETAIENDDLEQREITPINLNVKVKNGALVFENSKDLRHAEDILSKVDLASRLACGKKALDSSL